MQFQQIFRFALLEQFAHTAFVRIGDMRAEAMWRLAWRDYKDGNFDGARAWLQKQIDTMPIDHHFWAEGQAQYWMGRTFDRQKRPDDAAIWYQKTARLYPLSYYTLLALNRLREGHPDVFARVVQHIATPPAGAGPDEPAFAFKPRQIYADDVEHAARSTTDSIASAVGRRSGGAGIR